MNYYPITIIDNFYEDPENIRKFALSQEFKFLNEFNNYGNVFPGSRTKDLSMIDAVIFNQMCAKLTSIFHNYNFEKIRWSIASCFQSVCENFDKGVIHQDDDTIFAGVLFLTPNPEPNSGTTLFNKNIDFDESLYKKALKLNDFQFKSSAKNSYDYHFMFDEILNIKNVFNRLVIYEGHHYHAAQQFFGSSLETSRLTQTFFVKNLQATSETNFPIQRMKEILIKK